MLTKKFIVRVGGEEPKESIPQWRRRMKNENPNFKEVGISTYISERGGSAEIRYNI